MIVGVCVLPILFFCNLVRLFVWGVVTIYAGATALNPAPRIVATVLSFLTAYGLFVGVIAVASRLVIEPEERAPEDAAPPETATA